MEKHAESLVECLLSDPASKAINLEGANYRRDIAVRAVLETSVDLKYGEYLAGECLTFHQRGKNNDKVPPIYGLTADYFKYALLKYQNGARNNRVMSGPLGTEELAALSAVFA